MPERREPGCDSEIAPGDDEKSGPAAGKPPPGPGTGRENGPRDVLVVEDDPEINELVGAYARLAGFGYRSALDGAAALFEVRRHLPSVIVLDLMLPDYDGFEVCRQVRGERGGSDVPVIILSALDGDDYRRQGRACGVAEYLTKPFDPDQLINAISRAAKGNRGNAEC